MPAALHSSRRGAASNGVSTAQLARPRPLTVALHLALAARGYSWDPPGSLDNPGCSKVGDNCHGTRCCVQSAHNCYERDASFASCLKVCDPDDQKAHDKENKSWTCKALKVLDQKPIPPFSDDNWRKNNGTTASYDWDCKGMECDRLFMKTFDEEKFKAAPQYAPLDPADYKGTTYGEMIWMTGLFSDELSAVLGNDDGCCGFTNNGRGGCGRCIIVRNRAATNNHWMAVVMKKGRSPKSGKHVVLAVPGFADVNGDSACNTTQTHISEKDSRICSKWHEEGFDTMAGCECDDMPDKTLAEQYMKNGCKNFERWGWTSATVKLQYQPVECPPKFVDAVRGAFGKDGVDVGAPPDLVDLWPIILFGTTGLVCILVGTFLGIRRHVLKKQSLLDPVDGL